jgi:hypothetical protein
MKLNLSKCVAAGTSLIVASVLMLGAGPAGASSNKQHLLNAWNAILKDYRNITSAVRSNNVQGAEGGFIAFSRDCIPLATFETSFSSTIDNDIFQIAQVGNAWAWVGYITVSSNAGPGEFQTATRRLASDITKFNRDLSS